MTANSLSIIIAFIILPFWAYSQIENDSTKNVIIQEVELSHAFREEGLDFPEHIVSKYNTMQAWLKAICNGDRPQKHIATFEFNYFEENGKYTVYLIGRNTEEQGDSLTIRHIDFKPSNMYCKLPKRYYKHLSQQQFAEKLTLELKEFMQTATFQASFLSNAAAIITGYDGQTIWTK